MADAASKRANSPETRFRIGSITKQFTAMAVLILESRGLIERSDSICDYIDDCPEAWKDVTIEHLLDHTSGIANFTDEPDFDGLEGATPAQTVAGVADIPLRGEPGESFSYTNTGYVLLGMAIEKVSGKSYAAFLQDEIFGPLGMKDSGYEDGDTPGLATGYSTDFNVADPLDMSVPYAAGGLVLDGPGSQPLAGGVVHRAAGACGGHGPVLHAARGHHRPGRLRLCLRPVRGRRRWLEARSSTTARSTASTPTSHGTPMTTSRWPCSPTVRGSLALEPLAKTVALLARENP